jgi:hypothetical protein
MKNADEQLEHDWTRRSKAAETHTTLDLSMIRLSPIHYRGPGSHRKLEVESERFHSKQGPTEHRQKRYQVTSMWNGFA